MKIVRFSPFSFEPQYQNYHMENVHYHLFNFDISIYPKHLQEIVSRQHQEYVQFLAENYEDFQYGIWAFIYGHIEKQSLNHLKIPVPGWSAIIDDSTIVYDVDWIRKMRITDQKCKHFGFYIPFNRLSSLRDIKQLEELL